MRIRLFYSGGFNLYLTVILFTETHTLKQSYETNNNLWNSKKLEGNNNNNNGDLFRNTVNN